MWFMNSIKILMKIFATKIAFNKAYFSFNVPHKRVTNVTTLNGAAACIYCQLPGNVSIYSISGFTVTVPGVNQLTIGRNWPQTWWNTSTSAAHEIKHHKWTLSTKTFQMSWSLVSHYLQTMWTSALGKDESNNTVQMDPASVSVTFAGKKFKIPLPRISMCQKMPNLLLCQKLNITCVNMPMWCTFSVAEGSWWRT